MRSSSPSGYANHGRPGGGRHRTSKIGGRGWPIQRYGRHGHSISHEPTPRKAAAAVLRHAAPFTRRTVGVAPAARTAFRVALSARLGAVDSHLPRSGEVVATSSYPQATASTGAEGAAHPPAPSVRRESDRRATLDGALTPFRPQLPSVDGHPDDDPVSAGVHIRRRLPEHPASVRDQVPVTGRDQLRRHLISVALDGDCGDRHARVTLTAGHERQDGRRQRSRYGAN